MTASTRQEGGTHYTKLPIQPMRYSMENGLDPLQHTIIKYVTRFRDKGGIQDLRKAIHCLEMLIEHEGRNSAGQQDAPSSVGRDISPSMGSPLVPGTNLVARQITPLPVHETPEPTDPRMQVAWKLWSGGACPVGDDEYVQVRYNNRTVNEGIGSQFDWGYRNDRAWNIAAYRLHKPSQPAEPEKAADPHAELRKTWKPGQRWQYTRAFDDPNRWLDHPRWVEPNWSPIQSYRRHPDDCDPQGAQA